MGPEMAEEKSLGQRLNEVHASSEEAYEAAVSLFDEVAHLIACEEIRVHRIAYAAADAMHRVLVIRAHSAAVDGQAPSEKVFAASRLLSDWTLFHTLLRSCVNVHPRFEELLITTREAIAAGFGEFAECDSSDYWFVRLQATIAIQVFINGNVWTRPSHTSASQWRQSSGPRDALTSAMFGRVPMSSQVSRLREGMAGRGVKAEIDAWRRVVLNEPLLQSSHAQTIPRMGRPEDAVSQRVASQYESLPYPRWTKLGPPRNSLAAKLAKHAPSSRVARKAPEHRPRILVPGAGTGQHPLQIARNSPDCDVLAVDLSAASLGYSAFKAAEYGITNVRFLQADLLGLPKLGWQFDHIDCFGVLHHLADAAEGFRRLCRCLMPGGTIRLGVYSDFSRFAVRWAHRIIREEGIDPTPDAMRGFRSRLLIDEDPSGMVSLLKKSADFHSMVGLRDLLFHAHEQRVKVDTIRSWAETNGFRLQRIEFNGNSALESQFVERFPNLGARQSWDVWKRFEPQYTASGSMLCCLLSSSE